MKSKLKILMVITTMTSGGAERVMATLCNNFCKNNEIHLLCLKDASSDYRLDEKVHFIYGSVKDMSGIDSVRAIKKEIVGFSPDVILSFMTKTNVVALLAKLSLHTKIPVIVAERANPYKSMWQMKIARRLLFPLADGAVFQTHQAQDYYRNIIKCDGVVLRNPLSEDFSLTPYEGKRSKRIVCVGRLSEEKNQQLLINAFSDIADRYPDYTLEFYGDGPLMGVLQELISKRGMDKRIILMGRKQHIEQYIADAEIFVLPSDSEGMPNALLEAMVMGIACIATDCPIGGSAVIIENNVNGLLIPVGDCNALAESIAYLIDNPQEALRLGKEAEKTINTFDMTKVCGEWEDYVTAVAEK